MFFKFEKHTYYTYTMDQSAQKCPWCFRYMLGDDEIGTYNGDDPDYVGWMCHEYCNLRLGIILTDSDDNDADPVDSDDSDSTVIDPDASDNVPEPEPEPEPEPDSTSHDEKDSS